MKARFLALSLVLSPLLLASRAEAQPKLPPSDLVNPFKAPTKPRIGGPVAVLPPSKPGPSASSISELRRLSDAFVAVAEKVSPSVVQIEVTADGSDRSPLRRLSSENEFRGTGSGVIFTTDGAIITNNHVIEGARSINVRLRDGRIFPARLAGRDPATDLAVIRIDVKSLPAADFADSDAAKVGEWVVAIGSPFGLGNTVTTGVLSAKGRGGVGVNAVEDYLQTDASINPGNSGGPLVNLDGKVLGINTMIVSRGQGIGLAVPARMARRVADQLLQTGRVKRAFIGVGLQDLTPQIAAELPNPPESGALVNAVTPGSPAAAANIEPGDVIVSIDGVPARDAQDVIREVFTHSAGEALVIEVVRGGKRYKTTATLKERVEPAPPLLPIERQATPQPGLGLSLRDIAVSGGQGATVTQVVGVVSDSTADRAGVTAGDIILDADGVKQPTASQVVEAAKDGRLLLRLQRKSAVFFTALWR
ncbi:MAG: trypsin-like peptidase domain-containing protein [Polyangiaceae bacterium]|nr:trypsin-like peptidase domain-containing protein [Polyangiaceae bacterium]